MSFNIHKFVPNIPALQHVAPILGVNSSALPPGVSEEDHRAAQHQIWNAVETLVGPTGVPNELASATILVDRLLACLHHSDEKRMKILDSYLRARHGNAKEAFVMLKNTVYWRAEVKIDYFLRNAQHILAHPSAQFPMTVCSSAAACKQPVIYGLIRLLDKKKVEKQQFSDAIVAFFESLYYKEEYENENMIVILDFRGWSLRKHAPLRIVKDGLTTLQEYYPERLDRVFLCNYPGSIRAAYTGKIIAPVYVYNSVLTKYSFVQQ